MDRRGCLVLLLILIVGALVYAFATNTGMLDQLQEELQSLDSTASVIVAGAGENTPAAPGEPAPAQEGQPQPESGNSTEPGAPIPPTATPMPTPVPNGRILFLGLDESLWSIEADGSGAARMGAVKDLLAIYTSEWVSPDGRYVFVYQDVDGKRIASVVPVDGQGGGQTLGELPAQFGVGEPRSYFDFSSDSQRALFYESPLNRLVIVDLVTGHRIEWPVQPEAADFNVAAFMPGRNWFVLKGFDPAANGQYLELYNLGETLSDPQRSQVFANERIHQFQLSPDGTKIVQVNRSLLDNTERVLIVHQDGQVTTVLENSPTRSLLVSPAWSPDGRYLLINAWQSEPQLVYRLLSYDTQSGTLVSLLGDQPSTGIGQPISVAAGFAPDGAAMTFRLYSGNSEAFWLAFLDGSYVKQVAAAVLGAIPPSGEFVAGFTPAWNRMALVVSGQNALWGDLAAAAIDGSGRVALDSQVPYRYQELGPVISPDGELLAYFRLLPDTGQGELCIIGLDGSGKRVLYTARPEEVIQGVPVGIPWKWLPKP